MIDGSGFTKHDDDEANAWPISRFLAQKLHTIKMVKLVKRLCHELSAKELVATAKKMGLHVSKRKGRAEARKSIELVAETGPEVHKRVLVQLANRLTHDKIKKVLKDQEELIGETKSLTVRNLENSADLERKSQSVAGKGEGSISSSKAPGG